MSKDERRDIHSDLSPCSVQNPQKLFLSLFTITTSTYNKLEKKKPTNTRIS